MTDVRYWVGFNRITGVGAAKFRRLLDHFGDLSLAWRASPAELSQAGLDQKTCTAIQAARPSIDLDAELERLHRLHIRPLTWDDPDYPPRLRDIYDAPPLLYVRGSLSKADGWAIAVVGTRRSTAYGRQACEQLVGDLARSQITIVSGLAQGIDSVAHRAALAAGGRTIAVLACGLDLVYPSENLGLARQIMEQGALVSDYPLGMKPMSGNFPMRNRIISGLTLGTLVVEAGDDSGALLTAKLALDHNREVFLVPGSIFSATSRGTNRLIQESAGKLVTNAQDILQELNLTMAVHHTEVRESVPTDHTEGQLLRHLSLEPHHIDEICRQSGLPIATVNSTLTLLELKGLVKQVGSLSYVRV